MKRALELAKAAELHGEVPVGAVVVHEGKIIAEGFNHRETEQDPLGHAELTAIRAAAEKLNSWRLTECELFVTLEPCLMCLGACQQSRVKRVVYGARDPKGGAISLEYSFHQDDRLNHRFEAQYLETPECSQILKNFFSKLRSIPKLDSE